MVRVYVIAEGASEVTFLNDIVAPHLLPHQVYLFPFRIGVPGHKGGRVNYARVKKDVLSQLKQQPNSYCTTMFDLFRLGEGFPGTPLSPNLDGFSKAQQIENGIAQDIAAEVPGLRPAERFIPYIQVHEFEALLFSDPDATAAAFQLPAIATHLKAIRDAVQTPEHINEGPATAPSKRILSLHPRYDKRIDATLAAQKAGIAVILKRCPRFRCWVEKLSALHSLG